MDSQAVKGTFIQLTSTKLKPQAHCLFPGVELHTCTSTVEITLLRVERSCVFVKNGLQIVRESGQHLQKKKNVKRVV